MHNLGIVFSIIGVIHTHQYCSLANQQRILEPLHASCLAEEKAEMWRPAVFSRSLVLFTPPTLGEPKMPNQLWRRCLDPEITQTSVFFPLKLTLPSELVLIKGPGREQTFPHLQFTVSRASHRTAHLLRIKAHSGQLSCVTPALAATLPLCSVYTAHTCINPQQKKHFPLPQYIHVKRVFVHLVPTGNPCSNCLVNAGSSLCKQEQAVSMLLFPCPLEPFCV